MNTGTCPKCDKLLINVNAEEIGISVNFKPQWKGMSFTCPHCHTVIGIGIDPLLMRDQLLEEIAAMLGKRRTS